MSAAIIQSLKVVWCLFPLYFSFSIVQICLHMLSEFLAFNLQEISVCKGLYQKLFVFGGAYFEIISHFASKYGWMVTYDFQL